MVSKHRSSKTTGKKPREIIGALERFVDELDLTADMLNQANP
jgi:hypothetical protein